MHNFANYQLSQVFSHFFWKMYRKSCQVTYFTKLLVFFGGKTLHKLPNFPNYRGFNFWERPKVAHIEPYLKIPSELSAAAVKSVFVRTVPSRHALESGRQDPSFPKTYYLQTHVDIVDNLEFGFGDKPNFKRLTSHQPVKYSTGS